MDGVVLDSAEERDGAWEMGVEEREEGLGVWMCVDCHFGDW